LAVSRIFLSHSSVNNAEAIAIRDWMIAHGWDDVFLDLDPERGLKAGERWQKALKQAAEHCEMVVFLISPDWVESPWCRTEFLLAQTLNKRIFAVIVKPTPFSQLPIEMTAEWQITDLSTGALDYQSTRARSYSWPRGSRRHSPSSPCCATSSRPKRRPSLH
jgi:hypothetical protein